MTPHLKNYVDSSFFFVDIVFTARWGERRQTFSFFTVFGTSKTTGLTQMDKKLFFLLIHTHFLISESLKAFRWKIKKIGSVRWPKTALWEGPDSPKLASQQGDFLKFRETRWNLTFRNVKLSENKREKHLLVHLSQSSPFWGPKNGQKKHVCLFSPYLAVNSISPNIIELST